VGADGGTSVLRGWRVSEADESGAEDEVGGVRDRVKLKRGNDRTMKLDAVIRLRAGENLVYKPSGAAAARLDAAILLHVTATSG
jgi:hypothetical protein